MNFQPLNQYFVDDKENVDQTSNYQGKHSLNFLGTGASTKEEKPNANLQVSSSKIVFHKSSIPKESLYQNVIHLCYTLKSKVSEFRLKTPNFQANLLKKPCSILPQKLLALF